ncbi:MAG: hypothetical protein ACN4GZ_19105, partial [Acidimicrobiales bacterium]
LISSAPPPLRARKDLNTCPGVGCSVALAPLVVAAVTSYPIGTMRVPFNAALCGGPGRIVTLSVAF